MNMIIELFNDLLAFMFPSPDPFRALAVVPAVAGPLIAGAASVIGNIFGSRSAKKANQANKEIAQMNIDYQREEAEKNRAFQMDYFNHAFDRNAEYNDPSAQRARMEKAGYNPYMNPASAGSAESSTSTAGSQAQPVSTPSMQPYRNDFSGIGESLANVYETLQRGKSQEINNISLHDKNQALINQLIGNTDWSKVNPEYRMFMQSWGARNAQLDAKMKENAALLQDTEIGLNQANHVLLNARGSVLTNLANVMPQMLQLQLAKMSNDLFLQYMSGKLSYAQYRSTLADEQKKIAEANGIRIHNKVALETADGLIDATNKSNYALASEAKYRKEFAKYSIPYTIVKDSKGNVQKVPIAFQRAVQDLKKGETEALHSEYNYKTAPLRDALDAASGIMHIGLDFGNFQNMQRWSKSYRDWSQSYGRGVNMQGEKMILDNQPYFDEYWSEKDPVTQRKTEFHRRGKSRSR